MNFRGLFSAFRTLADALPPLVRKQRTLAAKLGDAKGSYADQEKAVRDEIDGLLVALKFQSGDGVTCRGYDVVHRERAGRESLNELELILELGKLGVTADQAKAAIAAATHRGEPSMSAYVEPSKGAKVRA